MSQKQNTPQATHPRRGSLLVVFLTVFIDLLGFGIVLPLLPIYAREFSADESGWTIAVLLSSFSFMQFIVSPLWGRLSDHVGRRPVLLVGLAGSVVFYAMFGIATWHKNLFLLFVSRIGAGVAGATISTAHAYIADTTSVEDRNKGMALVGAAFGLGFTFGPLVGMLALLGNPNEPGPGPGFAAAALSAVALLLAIFVLPESLDPDQPGRPRKWLDLVALRRALATPSIGMLLLTTFVCVVAFGNFESTISLLLKDERAGFGFTYWGIFWVFAYVGLVLALVQGAVVRPLATRVAEPVLAGTGTIVMVVGLMLLAQSSLQGSSPLLFVALAVCVAGFALITPSLNSLISRRSDPSQQGGIMGLAQSTSSLARIVGPLVGVPLLHIGVQLPMWVGSALLAVALVLIVWTARSGKDFASRENDQRV